MESTDIEPIQPHHSLKYKDHFPAMLEAHMANGLSLRAFAGVIGVCRDTLQEWCKTYPEFAEAKKSGEAKSLLFWEKLGVAGAAGKVKNFNAKTWEFNMKNRFREDWTDKQVVEHSGHIDGPAGASAGVVVYLPDNGRDKGALSDGGEQEKRPQFGQMQAIQGIESASEKQGIDSGETGEEGSEATGEEGKP